MDLVSIIIPVYKAEKWIDQCINSCLNQTYKNLNIILIVDGAFDRSGEICDTYLLRDKRINVIHQSNMGVSGARNTGIDYACGKYILFVDSDDFVDKTIVEELILAQKKNDYDLVISGYNYIGERANTVVLPTKIDAVSNKDLMKSVIDRKSFREFRSVWGKLFSTDIIKQNHILFRNNIKYGEDYCFVLNYIQHANSCISIEKALYNYRVSTYDKGEQYQTRDADYQWNNGLLLHQCFKESIVCSGIYEENKNKIDSYLLYRIRLYVNNMTSQNVSKEKTLKNLKSIEFSDYWNDIQQLKLKNCENVQERILLVFMKHRLWEELYFFFSLKNILRLR